MGLCDFTITMHRFNELMSELLSTREANGGPLPQEEESWFAARLAQRWGVMSEKEQREAVRKWTDIDKRKDNMAKIQNIHKRVHQPFREGFLPVGVPVLLCNDFLSDYHMWMLDRHIRKHWPKKAIRRYERAIEGL